MAKGGGGSWKVAYADFVTAMMAFFLVMWIGAQDQKTRQSVANYFVDPSGVSKKPAQTGAVMDSMTYGSVPSQDKMDMGKGRENPSKPREPSPMTRRVHNWLREDTQRFNEYRKVAQECRAAAGRSPEVTQKGLDPEDVATQNLARDIRVKISGDLASVSALYQDLLIEVMNDVNWKELAEDLLKH